MSKQTLVPDEIIVVFMNQPDHPALSGEITAVDLQTNSALPLAAARNRAAQVASCSSLVFLDVDCIPSATFAEDILTDLSSLGGLVMGTPRYLRSDWSAYDDLQSQSSLHPNRPTSSGPSNAYELFWSLCFATSADDFAAVGGFDESFVGYGSEDTDFAFEYRRQAIPFSLSEASVFHQFHPSYRPPLNHFANIISNAQQFERKWKVWPMEGWLSQFVAMGLVEWDHELCIVRYPNADEIAAAKSNDLFA